MLEALAHLDGNNIFVYNSSAVTFIHDVPQSNPFQELDSAGHNYGQLYTKIACVHYESSSKGPSSCLEGGVKIVPCAFGI